MMINFKKPRRFYFHYNKIASKGNDQFISLHCAGVCHQVDARSFEVRTKTEAKVNKRQPRVVIQGFCRGIHITEAKQAIVM